jgi:hypothetical protein
VAQLLTVAPAAESREGAPGADSLAAALADAASGAALAAWSQAVAALGEPVEAVGLWAEVQAAEPGAAEAAVPQAV